MAVLVWRTRVLDYVSSGKSLPCTIPGEVDARTAVGADAAGLLVEKADGAKEKLPWPDVTHEMLLGLARAEADVNAARLDAEEWMHLGHLASLAGDAAARATYTRKAVEMDSALAEPAGSPPEVELDTRILDEYSWTWDILRDPEPATDLTDDAPSIFHTYRYMRTVGLEKLQEKALHNPPYAPLVNRPAEYRGKTIRFEARYVKRFKSMRLTGKKGSRSAGIRDLEFCFVLDARVRGGIYLLSVPQDLKEFADSDIVTFTGVYVRRWPYLRQGAWKWVPWVAAHSLRPFEIGPVKGWRTMTFLLVAGALALFGVLAYFARRDAREGLQARDKLTRMRGGRDHIRRKVAEAVAGGSAGGGASGSPPPNPTPDAAGGPPPDGGEGTSG
jgi:hypothetical protein